MKTNQFYCVSCRKKVSILSDNICLKYINNSRVGKIPALKGECNKCDTKLTKFVKRDDAKKLEKKYGKC